MNPKHFLSRSYCLLLGGLLLLAFAACQAPGPEIGRTAMTPPLVSFVIDDQPETPGLSAARAAKSGKRELYLSVSDDDLDGDGIPDFADGFDAFAEIDEDATLAPEKSKLKHLRLAIPENVGANKVRIMFDYPESSLDQVRRRRHGSDWDWLAFWRESKPDDETWFDYTAPPGFRLWRKNGPKRDKRPVSQGGDFIPAGATLALTDLEIDGRQASLYVEAVPGAEDMPGSNLTMLSYTAKNIGRDVIPLCPILMQFVVKGDNGEIVPSSFCGVCTPRPQLKIKDLSPADIRIDQDRKLVSFTISCVELLDPVADNLPPGCGEIEEIRVYENYGASGEPMARTPVFSDRSGPASFWRQYPYRGSFKDLVIQFPLDDTGGWRRFAIRTSNNAAGLYESAEVELCLEKNWGADGRWGCREVRNHAGSGSVNYLPTTMRAKGIAYSEINEFMMRLGKTAFGVIQGEDGWLYPAIEGHVVIAVHSVDEENPGGWKTIYYPKVQEDALRKMIGQANGFFSQGKVAEAVAFFRQAAEKGDPNGQYMLAKMCEAGIGGEKSWDLAVHWLQRAAAQGHADAMNTLAYSWCLRNENLNEAKILIERALARDLESGHILHTAGKIHLKLGNDERALKCLEKANALVPDQPEHEEDLGDLYHKLGHTEEAVKLWRAAAAHAQDQEQKDRVELKCRNAGSPSLTR